MLAYPKEPSDAERTISVGQPKIWRYERVYPLLDGMLRDIEAALVQHLPLLDPNAANQSYLDFLRTFVGVQANYNQGVGIKNEAEVTKTQAAAKQQQIDDEYLSTLRQERVATEKQILTAEQQQSEAQTKVNSTAIGSPERDAAQKELDGETQVVTNLQTRKKQLDADIGTANQSAPSFSDSLSGDSAKTQPSTLPQFLDTVPESIKNKLFEKMDKSDLPASKQLDNYVTLLNERLAQQLLMIADDASRNGYELFMMQFDVGLYPSQRTKNKVARVEFQMAANPPSGKHPYAYGLIPGTSAYNIQEYIGRSQNLSVVGMFNLISGLGVRGEYQRQRDQLHTGLVQNVYTSGFENGQAGFGWYHGPAPFEGFVTPGLRTTYALIAVPKCTPRLEIIVQKGWQGKKGDLSIDKSAPAAPYEIDVPTYDGVACRAAGVDAVGDTGLKITRIAYQTKPNPLKSEDPAKPASVNQDTNTVALVLHNPADSNLTVTVGGKILKRVRDTRGQAVLTNISGVTATPPRGAFETDTFDRDTWILSNSKTLLLNISKDTAGSGFPVIRLSDSSTEASDITTSLLDPKAEVDINNWRFRSPMPRSALLPLFLVPACKADDRLQISLDQVFPSKKVRVIFDSSKPSVPSPGAGNLANDCGTARRLDEATQVVLDMGGATGQWPLACKQTGNDLICDVPEAACAPNAGLCIENQSVSVYEPESGITASARFISPEVLPHFDPSYQSVSYDRAQKRWTVAVSGIHISESDTNIRELHACGNGQTAVVAHPDPENYLEVGIPSSVYQECLIHDGFQNYHLLHVARLSTNRALLQSSSPLPPSGSGPTSGSVPIELTDLGWVIRSNAGESLTISKSGGATYRLSGTWFHPDWIDTLIAMTGPGGAQKLPFKPTGGVLLFDITEAMRSSSAPYFFRITIGSASFDLKDINGDPLCFNFKTERTCAASDQRQQGSSPITAPRQQEPDVKPKQ